MTDFVGIKVTTRVFRPEGQIVRIELEVDCGTTYEALVFYDDLSSRLADGEKIGLRMFPGDAGNDITERKRTCLSG